MKEKFSMKTLLALSLFLPLVLAGCATSQDEILGKASTTTEAVLTENKASSTQWEGYRDTSTNRFVERYGDEYKKSFSVRKGFTELAPRVNYLPNPRRVLYFYPRITALGNLEPAYAIEYPTYKEIHVVKP
jgi:conjugative transfer region lipoprotein (TIGR03751 family)